jgi:hypothetical protein
VVPSPRRAAGDLFVDLDPAYYRQVSDLETRFPAGAPSLLACRRFVVRGDVRFERDVVAAGSVTIEHHGPGQRVVPAGTRQVNVYIKIPITETYCMTFLE